MKKRKKKRRPSRVHAPEGTAEITTAELPDAASELAPEQPGMNGHRQPPQPATAGTPPPAEAAPADQLRAPPSDAEQSRPMPTVSCAAAPHSARPADPTPELQHVHQADEPAAIANSQHTAGKGQQPPEQSSQQQPCQDAAKQAHRQQEAEKDEPQQPPQPSAEELAQGQQEAAREALDGTVTQATNLLDIGAAAGLDTIASILGTRLIP